MGSIGKVFATVGTKERFLSGVDPLVDHQVSVSAERFAALGTSEGFFPGVNALVAEEIRLLAETFPAL